MLINVFNVEEHLLTSSIYAKKTVIVFQTFNGTRESQFTLAIANYSSNIAFHLRVDGKFL